MDLTDNPFYLLRVTCRDTAETILQKAEEFAAQHLEADISSIKSTLITPCKRIAAEIAWLPGLAPAKSLEFADRIAAKNVFVMNEYRTLYPLSLTNIIASYLVATGHGAISDEERTKYILTCASAYDHVNKDDLFRLLNEERSVSGMPMIPKPAALEKELTDHQEYLGTVLSKQVDYFSDPISSVSNIAAQSTNNGHRPAFTLIDKLLDTYELRTREHLTSYRAIIKEACGRILNAIVNAGGAYPSLTEDINKLISLLEKWDAVAQPIQILARSKGTDEELSSTLARNIRDFNITLSNEYSLHKEAKLITEVMSRLFAELPQLSDVVKTDISQLDGIIDDAEKKKKELLLDLEVGGNRLIITGESLRYQGREVQLREVKGVRWGILLKNGMINTSKYTAWLTNGVWEMEIECGRAFNSHKACMDRFVAVADKLWRAIGVRLMFEMLRDLSKGLCITYSNAEFDKNGASLEKNHIY